MMKITNTATTGSPHQSEHVSPSFQEQLNLETTPTAELGDASETIADQTPALDTIARRVFVPSNRERILQQLAALVLSPDFSPTAGTPAGPPRAPLVIHDGLRTAEIEILASGRPERFPVLAEIRSEACRNGAAAFGILDVEALHFRSDDEARAFRYRPVDELDTEHLPCCAAPSLFALDGAPRFGGVEPSAAPEGRRHASSADRIAGAVSCLLELVAVDPDSSEAVADLLSGAGTVPWLECVGGSVAAPEGRYSGAHGAIIRAFIEHEVALPGRLVESIGRHLVELSDPEVTPAVPAWLQRAEAVLSNRMVLDGKVLSDEGTIALRAAILAVVVDDVQDLVGFLYAARPAGRQVVVAAAFLIGLRTGVADLSWRKKRPYLGLLSPLLVALHHPEQEMRAEALAAFQVEPDEGASPLELALCWREHELVRWTPQRSSGSVAPLPSVTSLTVEREDSSGHNPTDAVQRTSHVYSVAGPDGRAIEVTRATSVSQPTSLRFILGESQGLRKQKEIAQAACTPGIFWRAGIAEDGSGALYADIPGSSSDDVLEAMILALPAALSLYLAPVKPKGRTRATKAKPVKENPA